MPLLRTVGGRLRDFRLVKRAVMHHGQRIAELLETRVNALLPEEKRIDFWLYMLAIVDLLRLRCDRLTGAEHELVSERGNDSRIRRERDEDSTTLRLEMQRFRNAFESNYLPVNLEEFGFPIALGDTPFELVRQADHLVETFSRPNLAVPKAEVGDGLPIGKLVGKIKAAADRVRLSLDETDREVKMEEFAKLDKDDAVADWDDLLRWAVRTIRGLFTLAGKPELAARVLPRPPRRGQSGATEEPDNVSGDGAGATGSTPPVDEEPVDGASGSEEQPPAEASASESSPTEPFSG